MAVNYKPVAKKNPQKLTEPPKYYVQLVNSGELSLRQLAKQIALRNNMSTSDTLAVLESFSEVVPQVLADGKIVRLGDFGAFSFQVSSEGSETEMQVTEENIRKISVKFRPGKEFTQVIDTISLNRID